MAYFRCSPILGGGGTNQVKIGEVKPSQTATTKSTKITCGFKPKYVCIFRDTGSETAVLGMIYDEDFSTTKYGRILSSSTTWRPFEQNASAYSMSSIDDDGFTIYTVSGYSNVRYRYFAIG